jgi:hypothetical protein
LGGLTLLLAACAAGLSVPPAAIAADASETVGAQASEPGPQAGDGAAVLERFRNASPAERRRLREDMRAQLRDASPEERRALRQQILEAWEQATPEERAAARARRRAEMAGRLERWRDMPEDLRREHRQKLREMTPAEREALRRRLRALPREERRALDARMRAYKSLDEEEQAALRVRLDELMQMSEEERSRLEANARRWESLSEAERQHRREQLRRLRAMDPEERARLLDTLLERSTAAPSP